VNAIAKELGVSGPALYRYFTNRDELLTELVVDAYHDLAHALAAATARKHRLNPAERLRALAGAYRSWANAEPHRYRLLFAAPFPGYDAQSDRLVTASQEAMEVLLDVLADLVPQQGGTGAPSALDEQLGEWARDRRLAAGGSAIALRAVGVWTRLHGFVSLEIEGNFASMSLDPDLLYDIEVTALLGPGGAEAGSAR
jgi:AcrR family transcriptional regulator